MSPEQWPGVFSYCCVLEGPDIPVVTNDMRNAKLSALPGMMQMQGNGVRLGAWQQALALALLVCHPADDFVDRLDYDVSLGFIYITLGIYIHAVQGWVQLEQLQEPF